jgi:branched-chain amino acid transport system substrate-binding protein
MRRFTVVALLCSLVVLGMSAAGSRAAEPPFEITAMMPMTGAGAFQGRAQAATLEQFAAYVNRTGGIRGRSIKFTVVDTQGSPQIAVQFMNDAVARKASVVIGPAFAAECSAVVAVTKNGPVDYCTSPGVHPDAGSFVFSAGISTVDLISAMVRYLRDRGLKRVALITSTDTTGQDGERSVDAALGLPANRDVTLVAREHFAPTDLNVTAQIARIKAAAPQAIMVWTTGSPFGTVLRNIQDAGLDVPVITTPGNQTYEQMSAYTAFLPKEMLFTTGLFAAEEAVTDKATRSAIDALYTSLDAKKLHPGYPSQTPWDPAQLLVAALRKVGTDATAAQVRDYIAGQRSWIGVNGRYDFVAVPQRGLDGSNAIVVRWDSAKATWVAASKLGGAPLK